MSAPRKPKWTGLKPEERQRAVAVAIGTALGDEPAQPQNSLVGLFCHKTNTDPELNGFGWCYQYQAHVHSVVGDIAMVQFFSAFTGEPTQIKPIALSEFLNGDWVFYPTAEDWHAAAENSHQTYMRYYRLTTPGTQ